MRNRAKEKKRDKNGNSMQNESGKKIISFIPLGVVAMLLTQFSPQAAAGHKAALLIIACSGATMFQFVRWALMVLGTRQAFAAFFAVLVAVVLATLMAFGAIGKFTGVEMALLIMTVMLFGFYASRLMKLSE
jgi:hypothetical protein